MMKILISGLSTVWKEVEFVYEFLLKKLKIVVKPGDKVLVDERMEKIATA